MTEQTSNFQNCKYCIYSDTCPRYEGCEYTINSEHNDYSTSLLIQLKKKVSPSKTKVLLPLRNSSALTNDNKYTCYEYYRNMINDCLRELRSGFTTYVYKEEHVAEILRFEPDIDLVYQDGIFYVTL